MAEATARAPSVSRLLPDRVKERMVLWQPKARMRGRTPVVLIPLKPTSSSSRDMVRMAVATSSAPRSPSWLLSRCRARMAW